MGLAATREAFAATFAQPPDLRFESRRVYIGDAHFVSEYQVSGTSEGKPFACEGVDVIAVSDGLVARKDTYLDSAAMERQLAVDLQGG